VAIARALVHEPKLIICDEPTSNLDHKTGIDMMKILRRVARNPERAIIVVTHDPRISAQNSDFLRDAGRSRSPIEENSRLIPALIKNAWREPSSSSRQALLSPRAAAKRIDRQRSGGQIAGEGLARVTVCARSAPVES